MRKTKEETRDQVIKLLDSYPLEGKIEVMANVFIAVGTSFLDLGKTEIKDVTKSVLDDLERNGETLPNALARQGLILLTWLSKGKNDDKQISRNIHNI